MNTRLQVEHCVTEMITGIDLVEEQIKVASGEKLSFTQDELSIHGHAIELRICAEDPLNQFLPDIGKLEVYKRPVGEGIRVDDGYEEGMDIPIYYDPMIGKLIAWGPNRMAAVERLTHAIEQFRINGIETTLPFGKWAINHPAFLRGEFDTHFIANYYKPELLMEMSEEQQKIASVMALGIYKLKTTLPKPVATETNKWSLRKGMRA
jgi:acetyl-CoA carboxylase biotin carboxylase subunit